MFCEKAIVKVFVTCCTPYYMITDNIIFMIMIMCVILYFNIYCSSL